MPHTGVPLNSILTDSVKMNWPHITHPPQGSKLGAGITNEIIPSVTP